MKNADNKCFMWSIYRFLNPVKKNAERIDKNFKEFAKQNGIDDFEYAIICNRANISKMENRFNISINFFGHKKSKFFL